MARNEYIRGTRSRAPYGYARDGRPKEGPGINLLAWFLVIILLTAMAICSWLFPAYIFSNPHVAFNYDLLRKVGKLEDIKAFSVNKPPNQKDAKFLSARELYAKSGLQEEQLGVLNDIQKRLYVQNYGKRSRDVIMLGYIRGDFKILESRVLGEGDFFPGLALRAVSQEFPNIILELLLSMPGEIVNPYEPGDSLTLGSRGELAAILHLAHLPEDRLSATAVPLTYLDRNPEEGVTLDIEPPAELNMRADWPVFAEPPVITDL